MIQTTISKNIYLGDGTTRKFAVTFQYETKNNTKQIDLYTCTYSTDSGTTKYNNDVQQITTNYDYVIEDGVTYVKYPSDAAVNDGASPMSVGTAIIIMRNTPQEQLSTGPYNSNNVMTQLDKLTMISQDIQEQVNRCYKRPAYSEQVNDIDIDPTGSIEQIYEAAHDASVAAEYAEGYAEDASTYAINASNSATDAYNSATNASGSATAAANSATACATACQTALAKINVPLLSFKWYDHLLNDQRWLRTDTFSWQDGETYLSAYQHLLDDIGYVRYMIPNDDIQEKFYRSPSNDTTMFAWTNQYSTLYTESEFPENGDNFYYHNQVFGTVLSTGTEAGSDAVTPTTETIAGTTITYYLADDGHKICLANQETNVQNIYIATGVAWYYILDTGNTRFKLPRTEYAFVGLRDAVGKYVPESLPDGEATLQMYAEDGATINHIADGGNNTGSTVSIKLSDFNSVFQTNAPVQQRSTQMYLYFYVGQFTQSATEQTAGLNAELFNGKADLNLNNITSIDKIASALGPDTDAGVSLPSGTTLTQNGWIVCSFEDISYGIAEFKLNSVTFLKHHYAASVQVKNISTIFGSKGQTFTISTSGDCTVSATFYPVKGV